MKYRKAFIRNDKDRYSEFLQDVQSGNAKINTETLTPVSYTHLVRCNKRVRKADIERFICEKEKWINEKLELMRNRKSVFIGNGSKILYLGKEYEIVVSESKEGMYDDKFFVHPSSDERYVYIVLEKFYKQKAKEIIAERLHKYEQIMDLYSTKFGITSANTRWGCLLYTSRCV